MQDHSLIARDVLPRQLAQQYFQTIVESDEPVLAAAVDWFLQAVVPLSLTDCAKKFQDFARDKNVQLFKSEAEAILQAMFSLEGLRDYLNWSGSDLFSMLAHESKEKGLLERDADVSNKAKLMDRFFGESEKLERTRRAQRVYDGLLPNFESCSSIIDFRPIFDESGRTILSGIIAATLTLEIREGAGANLEKISVQLDASDIDALVKELNRLGAKMEALEALARKNTVLLNPSRSLRVEDE